METPLFEIALGKTSVGCSFGVVTPADMFLGIMPKLKDILDTEVPKVLNPVYSNEMSPAAVKFMSKDGKLLALYRRDVVKKMYSRITQFSNPTSYDTIIHNVICIYDRSFCDIVKKLTNGALDIEKMRCINNGNINV